MEGTNTYIHIRSVSKVLSPPKSFIYFLEKKKQAEHRLVVKSLALLLDDCIQAPWHGLDHSSNSVKREIVPQLSELRAVLLGVSDTSLVYLPLQNVPDVLDGVQIWRVRGPLVRMDVGYAVVLESFTSSVCSMRGSTVLLEEVSSSTEVSLDHWNQG